MRVLRNLLTGVDDYQKTIGTLSDEAKQRIINEEAESRLVAAYINGLAGLVGQQVRFRMSSLDEAV
jgi:hypothetical protein